MVRSWLGLAGEEELESGDLGEGVGAFGDAVKCQKVAWMKMVAAEEMRNGSILDRFCLKR